MFIHSHKKAAVMILLFNLISLLFIACSETRQFDIALFLKDYGLDIHPARIISSERIDYNRKKFAVGEFYISVEKWNIVVSELKEKYRLINHFQGGDVIDGRNRKLLNIPSAEYDIYPFQIYSSNAYFYFKEHDGNMYVKCLIEFN